MTKRLLKIAVPVKSSLTAATVASVVGNLAKMGLMGFGALFLLACAGIAEGSVWLYAVLMVCSGILIALGRYIEGVTSHAGAYRLLASMRVSLFDTVRALAPACLMDRSRGDIVSIAVSDIETVEYFFAHTIGPMFTVIILPCTTLALAFLIHPLYALVLLPIYLIISVLLPLAALKVGRSIGMDYRTELASVKTLVLESVYGLRDIQIFGYGEKRRQQLQEQNRKVNRAAHGLTLHKQVVSAAPSFFVYLARILILLIASILVARGITDVTGTVVISFAATASFSSTFSLTTVVSSLLETFAAAERLFILEDMTPAVIETETPLETGPIESIVFQDVSFRYTDDTPQVLDHFSLEIRKGERLGIMGESGAGKSTILRLLLRFWDTDSGSILINGIPVQDISLAELRCRIAVLEQDTFLFDGTIAENIALARPEASPEEIAAAAKRAGIHDFIRTLPEGYNTPMGQMSARLSGGERQRVGIARVLLADPDVIVMDEPTSSLDVLHEKELLKTLREESQDKTLIIISHRQSTLSDCRRIIQLRQGQAAE